jgi:anti-sigma factor RsiW
MMPDLVCRDGVELLMDYLEGVLSETDREAIEAHVGGCPRCVAFVASYRDTPRILRAATAAELPTDVAASLRRFLAERR